LATLVMAIIIYPLRNNLIAASVASLIYFPTLYLFRGFTSEDIREIISLRKPAILPGELLNE
jgi:hypothetical protein